jgi:hypothetical protein
MPLVCLLFYSGPDQLLPMGATHTTLPGAVGFRSMSHMALRKQTFWNQHGGHNGRCATQFTSSLLGNTRKGTRSSIGCLHSGSLCWRPINTRLIIIALTAKFGVQTGKCIVDPQNKYSNESILHYVMSPLQATASTSVSIFSLVQMDERTHAHIQGGDERQCVVSRQIVGRRCEQNYGRQWLNEEGCPVDRQVKKDTAVTKREMGVPQT